MDIELDEFIWNFPGFNATKTQPYKVKCKKKQQQQWNRLENRYN